MNFIIDTAMSHSRTVFLILLLILISGAAAYMAIPKESDPDVNIPIIYVSMKHEGISPEDAELLLIRPMEKELRSVEGIKELRATASEGHASILIEFEAGFDADTAVIDIREKVDTVQGKLPKDTEEPSVNEVNVGLFPVLVVVLSGDSSERQLLRLSRDLRDQIEALPGVLEVQIAGHRDEVLEIIIDPARLESYGISYERLLQTVTRNNQVIAAGAVDTGQGRFSVKVPGLIKNLNDILSLPLKVEGDAVVTVGDITAVRRGFKDPTTFARLGGKPAIALEIKKRLGENVIDTISDVQTTAQQQAKDWPKSIQVTFIQDKSVQIKNMLTDLQNNVFSAIMLVMIVVIAALGIRSAGLVGLAIPGSFLSGILVLFIFGLTMNIVVLFSLILAVGMLVDGAIVVTEFANRRIAEGVQASQAYSEAAKRMAGPITASTATTLAAFMPLLFWPGVVGEFMKFLPITLIATLSASMAMALIFVPTIGAYSEKVLSWGFNNPQITQPRSLPKYAKSLSITDRYTQILSAILRHPAKVIISTIALFIGVQTYYAAHGNGFEFFPDVEPQFAQVLVHARGNLSIYEMDHLVGQVEREVLNINGIKTAYTRVGRKKRQGDDLSQDVIGAVQIEFKDWTERRPAKEIFSEIMKRTSHLAGILVEISEPAAGPPTGKAIQLHFSSKNAELIEPALEKALVGIRQISGLVEIEDTRNVPGIEWQLLVNREQASRFGADLGHVGNVVKLVTNGLKIDEYLPEDSDKEIDIHIRHPLDSRTLSKLDGLRVTTAEGLIPISNFVKRHPQKEIGIINRTDGRRVLAIKADVADGVLADDKVKEIKTWLATQNFDKRVLIEFKGEDKEQRKAQAFLLKAFGVALFIMAIILVTQFNSFYHAFLILSAVVMSTIGVMIGLLISGQAFGIVMTGVGVITLAGIVVNNNIVLIDTYDRLLKTGLSSTEAVIESCAQRLRPVALTAVTTVLGLMPMVLALNVDILNRTITSGGPSTQWWCQLATAIASGLTFATVFTLVITPTLLVLGSNTRSYIRQRSAKA